MTELLEIKERIKSIYSRFDIYIMPVFKFLLMFIALSVINSRLGYMDRLDNSTLVLLISIASAVLPNNFMLLIAAAFVVLHLYAFSLECAIVVMVMLLLMFLLYFRFASGDSILLLLTPICSMLHIPFVVPVSAGLLGGPASAVAVCCGSAINSIIDYISENEAALNALDAENTVQRYRMVVDGLIDNKAMLVTMAALGACVVIVYIIRRLTIDHSWTIAIAAGLILSLMVLFGGELVTEAGVDIIPLIPGAAVSFLILCVLQFFVFSVDYQRTERVQFEDDEYYYYVKAVPKMTVGRSQKTVKKITRNTQSPASYSPKSEDRKAFSRSSIKDREIKEHVPKSTQKSTVSKDGKANPSKNRDIPNVNISMQRKQK